MSHCINFYSEENLFQHLGWGGPEEVEPINLPVAIQFCSQEALHMHYRQITYEVTLISSDQHKNSSVIVDLAMGQIPRSTVLHYTDYSAASVIKAYKYKTARAVACTGDVSRIVTFA